ncbi:MAG TPA: hypothetical protein O0X88_01455, partial [Methanocorpusculum sp.]|nr:hypothetical protein [Methanocorpusculum sp.]
KMLQMQSLKVQLKLRTLQSPALRLRKIYFLEKKRISIPYMQEVCIYILGEVRYYIQGNEVIPFLCEIQR